MLVGFGVWAPSSDTRRAERVVDRWSQYPPFSSSALPKCDSVWSSDILKTFLIMTSQHFHWENNLYVLTTTRILVMFGLAYLIKSSYKLYQRLGPLIGSLDVLERSVSHSSCFCPDKEPFADQTQWPKQKEEDIGLELNPDGFELKTQPRSV